MEDKSKLRALAEHEFECSFSHSGGNNTELDNSIEVMSWIQENQTNIPTKYLAQKKIIDPENQDFSVFSFYNRNASNPIKLFKRTRREEDANFQKKEALRTTWVALVLDFARETVLPPYEAPIEHSFLEETAKLSQNLENLSSIFHHLNSRGIGLVIVDYLEGSEVDGVVTFNDQKNPIIGMSLRYDRLDNFWFSLLHELSHVIYHLEEFGTILDNFAADEELTSDEIEHEANYYARDAIIPRQAWKRSDVSRSPTEANIHKLANEFSIHPALVVGRIHWETDKYFLHRDIVHEQSVRDLLKDHIK